MGKVFQKQETKKKLQIAALLLGLVMAGSYFITSISFEKKINAKRTPEPELIVFKDLPENIQIEAFLQNSKGTQPIAVDHHKLVLTTQQRSEFSIPYRVNAKLTQGTRYYDLSWKVDGRGVEYAITLDGFHSDDRLTFNFNGSDSVKNIPFDWSGRVTLDAFLIKTETISACVTVTGEMPFSVCHTVTGDPEAAV